MKLSVKLPLSIYSSRSLSLDEVLHETIFLESQNQSEIKRLR